MDAAYFKNRLRGLKIVLAFLEAESEDELCRGCIGFDGAATKVKKGFKKLKLDLQSVEGLEEEKKALVAQIDQLSQQAERLPEANDPTWQKTAGLCKIGPDCFSLDGTAQLMNQIS